VKSGYNACVMLETTLNVYWSGNWSYSGPANDPTYNNTCYRMDIPIPSYLIAVAMGNIASTNVGGRCTILTEPGFMAAAVAEYSNCNQLLDAVQTYVNAPYIFGTYNMLLLPPSFPFGGMENPLLNFISPTTVTGTKSQVYVTMHEMAHSWTGDSVTMNNWEDFWLNEGYTTFIERTVSGRLYGGDF
jgi:leukotriene-A4 hydrolase